MCRYALPRSVASHPNQGRLCLSPHDRHADEILEQGDSMGPRTVGTVDPSTDWTPERSRPGWSSFRGSARLEEITGVSSKSKCGGASTPCRERWEAIQAGPRSATPSGAGIVCPVNVSYFEQICKNISIFCRLTIALCHPRYVDCGISRAPAPCAAADTWTPHRGSDTG
jgi:hypothetical protein